LARVASVRQRDVCVSHNSQPPSRIMIFTYVGCSTG
jgi:hypothetical protein